jgi:cell division protein FtsL
MDRLEFIAYLILMVIFLLMVYGMIVYMETKLHELMNYLDFIQHCCCGNYTCPPICRLQP